MTVAYRPATGLPARGGGRDPLQAASVAEAFDASVKAHPDSVALVMSGRRFTFAQLHASALEAGAALRASGVARGDRIGLLLDNSPEYLELILGCVLAGVAPALFNTKMTAAQLAGRLPSLDLKALFVGASERSDLVRAADAALASLRRDGDLPAPKLVTIDAGAPGRGDYDAFLAAGEDAPAMPAEAAPGADDPVLIVFTAGLTGPHKTCRISNANLMSKVGPLADRFELEASSRLWLPVPMFQIGFVTPFLTALFVGATTIATEEDDPAAAVEALHAEGVTHAYPIYLNRWLPLIYHIDFLPSRVPELSHACVIGPVDVLKRTQRVVPQCTIMNTYGSPEQGGAFCFPESSDPADLRLGSSGRPFPGHEIRIVDPVNGRPRRAASVGEVQVRGAGVPRPEAQDEFGSTFTADGWLRTGDLGSLSPDGYLAYGGRLSEMLTIDGDSVSALTIEAVLGSHPAVALAQVVGRPDATLGEVAVAFVELRPGGDITDDKLVAFCRTKLPQTQVPRFVTFVTDWPTSASKILKPALAEMPLGRRLIA